MPGQQPSADMLRQTFPQAVAEIERDVYDRTLRVVEAYCERSGFETGTGPPELDGPAWVNAMRDVATQCRALRRLADERGRR